MSKRKEEKIAKEIIEGNYQTAEEVLKDADKFEYYIQKFEEKFKDLPMIGNTEIGADLANLLPDMISMTRARMKGDYKDLPIGTLLVSAVAIVYAVAPDVIPGPIDDTILLGIALKEVSGDVKDYQNWRVANGKDFDSSLAQVEKGCEKRMGLKRRKEIVKEKKEKGITDEVLNKGKLKEPER